MSESSSGDLDFDDEFFRMVAGFDEVMPESQRTAKVVAEYARDGEVKTSSMTKWDRVSFSVPLDSHLYPTETSRTISGYMIDSRSLEVYDDTVNETGLTSVKIVLGSFQTDEQGQTTFVPGRINATDQIGYHLNYALPSDAVSLGSAPEVFEFNNTPIFGGETT